MLLPFFDVGALSAAMIRAVREQPAFGEMRRAAGRRARTAFDRATGTAGWLRLIDEQLARGPA
jgi:hypothetical protein